MSPKPRRERGIRVVSERDVQAYRWIVRHYALRRDQVARLLRRRQDGQEEGDVG